MFLRSDICSSSLQNAQIKGSAVFHIWKWLWQWSRDQGMCFNFFTHVPCPLNMSRKCFGTLTVNRSTYTNTSVRPHLVNQIRTQPCCFLQTFVMDNGSFWVTCGEVLSLPITSGSSVEDIRKRRSSGTTVETPLQSDKPHKITTAKKQLQGSEDPLTLMSAQKLQH